MCFKLLTNKYFLLGLFIWCLPTLVFWAYIFATIKTSGYYPLDLFFIGFLIGFIASFFVMPFLLILNPFNSPYLPSGWITIIYYVIAYGLVYLYYRELRKHVSKRDKS